MKAAAMVLLALAITSLAPTSRAGAPALLGVAGRPAVANPPALTGGESVTLRLLADHAVTPAASSARLFQFTGAVAKPVEAPVALEIDPADPRVLLVRFTPPPVSRVARLALRFDDAEPLLLHVLPAGPRNDLSPLADALADARLRLLVCGKSPELRAWLRAEKLDFEDVGADPPLHPPADTLLIGPMSEEDWDRLGAADSPSRPCLAFVDTPGLLPGVYAEPAARRAKATLPLLPDLPFDPLARRTLHALILQVLSPSHRPAASTP